MIEVNLNAVAFKSRFKWWRMSANYWVEPCACSSWMYWTMHLYSSINLSLWRQQSYNLFSKNLGHKFGLTAHELTNSKCSSRSLQIQMKRKKIVCPLGLPVSITGPSLLYESVLKLYMLCPIYNYTITRWLWQPGLGISTYRNLSQESWWRSRDEKGRRAFGFWWAWFLPKLRAY